ncbi:Nck-associated protein 5-like [Bagarius yarrelli]|uniref:Nck-associated protein 5-like n=1 Tax=Bagarius yarrelli TaxID=175774 RepID=A0A556VWJ5_BAGYA|nr:Nck-associated protein 5-like [Bagarius yarrelli]
MSGVSERRECEEESGSVEGDTDVILEEDEEEDEEEEEEESMSNKDLTERLRELEAENRSLSLANESQREAYERCLDEFDSKRSRPVFGYQQSGVRQTRSGEELKHTLIFTPPPPPSGSMRTLDSGIGTFPLPDYAHSAAGKLNPKLRSSSVSHSASTKPRKTLASLDEVNTSVIYTSPLEAKGASVHLSCTIHEDMDVYGAHFQAPPTGNWAFPNPRGSEGLAEPHSQHTPPKPSLDKVSQGSCDVESRTVFPSGGRRKRSQSHRGQDMLKDRNTDLTKEQSEELSSPNRPQASESLSDSLYDSLSSCGSQG